MSAALIRQLFAELSADGAEVKEDTLVLRILQAAGPNELMRLARAGAEEIVRRALTDETEGEPVAEEALVSDGGRYRLVYVPHAKPLGAVA